MMPQREEAAGHPRSPASIELFPLNAVLFPGGPLPLRIFEPRYVDLVRRCMRHHAEFGVVLIHSGAEAGAVERIAQVGTSARIADFYQLPDGLLGIACVGGRRFRVRRHWCDDDGLNRAEIDWLAPEAAVPLPARLAHLGELLRRILPQLGDGYDFVERRFDDAGWVGGRLAEVLPLSLAEKQGCLELDDPLARLERLNPWIRPCA